MKRYLLSLIFCSLAVLAFAVPAARVTVSHTQQDGTVLSLTLVGDEHFHYYVNEATGEAMRLGTDGDYYAISEQDLAAMKERADAQRAVVNQERASRLAARQAVSRPANGPARIGAINSNLSGNKDVLVLLVAFSDKAFTGTQQDFNNQFNQQNYTTNSHIGSVHDYFYDQSYGALNLHFDVYGPVTLSNTMDYYGANDSNGDDVRPQQMVKDALTKANQSYDIDYTKYDWDNDGEVDQVVIIYAGYAESQGASENTIWPHQWAIGRSSSYRFDGKYVNNYACLSELLGKTGSTRDGIGTFCHEFSHCLGLPDFYDTDYSGNGSANDMSYFDVMASGSYNGSNNAVPCGYTAYERWQFGWVTPTELREAATISGMKPLNDANPDVYVIYNQRNRNEYFLLENRQSNRWFKYSRSYTAGHGLFITHCNYVSSYWTNNTINATAGDEHFVYVPANRSYSETSTNMQKAFFPAGATSFTDDSHASYGGALWTNNSDGTRNLGVPITDIAETNGLISFDVLGGMHDDGSRYTVTLNACGGSVSPTSWTQTSYRQTWPLPEPQTTVAGWDGIGWLTYELNTYKPLDAIIDDIINYDAPYEPESNVTLYAVYSDNDEICHSRPANYTISFNAGAGACATTSWAQGEERSLTLPVATIDIDGWSFAGWATESVEETNTLPSFVASPYHPASDVTLYAVYKKTETATGDNIFRLSTTLTAGNRYVFVTSNTAGSAYAISKDNLLDLGTANRTTAGVAITVANDKTVVPTDAMIWICSTSDDAFNLMNGSDYLGINGNGIGKRSTAVNLWWSSDDGLYGKNSKGTTSYYAKLNNATIQTATSPSTTNRIYAYEAAAAGSDITTYSSNPQAEELQPGDGGDEEGEEEGEDITITPISGIPAGYYNSTIEGQNDRTLELALKAIVNPHTKISYSSLWNAFKTTDPGPADSIPAGQTKTDLVYDMYAWMKQFPKFYSDNDHTQTGGFNREHVVPNSWWGGSAGNATAYTDLHHLVPSDGAANNAKANYPLGEYQNGCELVWPMHDGLSYYIHDTNNHTEGEQGVICIGSTRPASHVWKNAGKNFYEPTDEYKGDFARMYLYVVCAYEGDLSWQTADNTMFSNGTNNYTQIASWAKELLLKWHRQDPVSDKERMRNNAVQSIQGNRNPFIDYPILAEYIWGDSIAKTSFSLETMPSAYQFAVTYRVGTNVACNERVSLCDRGSAVTLPAATTTVEGWTFSGWVTSPIENTTTAPAHLLTGNYTPLQDIELFAVFQAGDTYSISPEAIETPDTPDAVGLYFPHIAKLGQPFAEPAFATNSDGAQTWTSSNTAVAEVDNEGKVTIKAVGTAIITVTQAETATYEQASASYMIQVIE